MGLQYINSDLASTFFSSSLTQIPRHIIIISNKPQKSSAYPTFWKGFRNWLETTNNVTHSHLAQMSEDRKGNIKLWRVEYGNGFGFTTDPVVKEECSHQKRVRGFKWLAEIDVYKAMDNDGGRKRTENGATSDGREFDKCALRNMDANLDAVYKFLNLTDPTDLNNPTNPTEAANPTDATNPTDAANPTDATNATGQ
jgi:hypothetical protein